MLQFVHIQNSDEELVPEHFDCPTEKLIENMTCFALKLSDPTLIADIRFYFMQGENDDLLQSGYRR